MGSPTDPNGRLRVSSSITNIGTNRYRIDINLSAKSNQTWNDYGLYCYAHIGSSKIHLGTFKITSGICKPSTYSMNFDVTTNTTVYASCICTHCNGSDGWSGRSNPDTAVYTSPVKPNSPPPVPAIYCLNYAAPGRYLVERTLDVELSEVRDPDGDTVRYVIYAQYKSPGMNDWASAGDKNNCILYDTNQRRKSINIEKYARGTQFRIWGKAEDVNHGGAISGETGKIENIYRRQALTSPVLHCIEDQFNGNHIIETSLSVSLSNSTDPENLGSVIQHYICGQYKPPGGNWIAMGDNNIIANSLSTTIRVDRYERGTQFKLWGYATENHFSSNSDNSNTISNIYRNRKPNQISVINPESKIIIGNAIDISWQPATDPDGQMVKYSVWLKVNDGHYDVIVDNVLGTTFNLDVSLYEPGTEFQFKVMPNDGMVNGDPTFSPIYKKDFSPSFILPINNSTLYQNNPRIVTKRMRDSHLYVSYDDISFNTNNNADRFRENVKTLSDGISSCFNPVLSTNKKTSMTIYCVHNKFESSRISLDINIEPLSLDLSGAITKNINDSLLAAINKIRQAYKLQNISIPNINVGETIVNKSHITEMTNGLDAVRNVINEYDSNKINSNWNNNSDNIIRRSDFQQILEGISNV